MSTINKETKEMFELIETINTKRRELIWRYETIKENQAAIEKVIERNNELNVEIKRQESELVALITQLTGMI